MKSLKESLFDKNIVSKDITIGQCFDVSIDHHKSSAPRTKDDEKVIKELTKTISSMSLKQESCVELIKTLAGLTKEYVKKWMGGGYSYRIYNDQKHLLNSKQIENANLINDVNMISLSVDDWDKDWDKNHDTFRTYIELTRK